MFPSGASAGAWTNVLSYAVTRQQDSPEYFFTHLNPRYVCCYLFWWCCAWNRLCVTHIFSESRSFSLLACYLFLSSSSLFLWMPLRQKSALCFSGLLQQKRKSQWSVQYYPSFTGIAVILTYHSLGLGMQWHQCSHMIFNYCQEIFISKCPQSHLLCPGHSHDCLEARKWGLCSQELQLLSWNSS